MPRTDRRGGAFDGWTDPGDLMGSESARGADTRSRGGHNTSPPKGRPTPRRGEQRQRARARRLTAKAEWILVAFVLVCALVIGGIAWGGSGGDGSRRVTPIGGHR